MQVIAWLETAAAVLLEEAVADELFMQVTAHAIMQGTTAEGLQASAVAEEWVVEGSLDGTQVGMSIAHAPDLQACPAAEHIRYRMALLPVDCETSAMCCSSMPVTHNACRPGQAPVQGQPWAHMT